MPSPRPWTWPGTPTTGPSRPPSRAAGRTAPRPTSTRISRARGTPEAACPTAGRAPRRPSPSPQREPDPRQGAPRGTVRVARNASQQRRRGLDAELTPETLPVGAVLHHRSRSIVTREVGLDGQGLRLFAQRLEGDRFLRGL